MDCEGLIGRVRDSLQHRIVSLGMIARSADLCMPDDRFNGWSCAYIFHFQKQSGVIDMIIRSSIFVIAK